MSSKSRFAAELDPTVAVRAEKVWERVEGRERHREIGAGIEIEVDCKDGVWDLFYPSEYFMRGWQAIFDLVLVNLTLTKQRFKDSRNMNKLKNYPPLMKGWFCSMEKRMSQAVMR